MIRTVSFDKLLYSRVAIQQAIHDYASIAQIVLEEDHQVYQCKIHSRQYPIDTVCSEFKNYVLDLTVQLGAKNELD